MTVLGVDAVCATLEVLNNQTEREKILRRLPAESGMEPLGVRMKDVLDTAKAWADLPLPEVPALLTSRWYEMRMVGVAILDGLPRPSSPADPESSSSPNLPGSSVRG